MSTGIDTHSTASATRGRSRFNELLECVERECRTTLDERCLLIFDEETSTSRELFQVVHDRHRQTLLAGEDPRIVERPVIAPSHHTPGIQVADVAVYLRRREYTQPTETDPRAQAARDELTGLFRDRVTCEQAP